MPRSASGLIVVVLRQVTTQGFPIGPGAGKDVRLGSFGNVRFNRAEAHPHLIGHARAFTQNGRAADFAEVFELARTGFIGRQFVFAADQPKVRAVNDAIGREGAALSLATL